MSATTSPYGQYHAGGARLRPTDPRELRYALRRTLRRPGAVDLGSPRLVRHSQPVRNQGWLGSCAAFASETAAGAAREHAGAPQEPLHAGWLYYHARALHGWQGEDTGSYPADNLDLLMAGAPRAADAPYSADARWVPPVALEEAPRYDYVLSHRPIYPAEGHMLEDIWMALDAGMPVVAASWWPAEWFSPVLGVLPDGVPVPANPQGGHAWVIWGIAPGYLLAQNSWGEGWAADAPQCRVLPAGVSLRPGQFAVPWSYAQSGMLWEARAVALERVAAPEPQPEPEPVARPRKLYVQVWTPRPEPEAEDWQITATEQEIGPAGAWVTVKAQTEGQAEEVVIDFTLVT